LRILVTGGAGFLGSHLCRNLINRGISIVCLDNFYTGEQDNISDLVSNPLFALERSDVRNSIDIAVDGIFNLACPASPIHYHKNPVETLTTNIQGAINVLDLATGLGVRVLQASTSEIYGDPTESPQRETYWGNVNPIGIRSCYDEGKRAAETLFFDYHREFDVDIRVARIFNTYGPGMAMQDGRVVSNFIVQALTNQDITIYGNGEQTRSLCYVDDLIEGLVSLFFTDDFTGPVNLGNPDPISMNDLAEEIITLTKSKSKIKYLALPGDDPVHREPDISIAKERLSWTPQIPRDQGLRRTIEYFRTLV
jgi:UDP-glucuronate decarboxylase